MSIRDGVQGVGGGTADGINHNFVLSYTRILHKKTYTIHNTHKTQTIHNPQQ
jgi:hypothetical protein